MGRFQEYDHYDGLGLAELVRQGQITPRSYARRPSTGSNGSIRRSMPW